MCKRDRSYTPLLDNMEALNGNVYQLTRFYDAQ